MAKKKPTLHDKLEELRLSEDFGKGMSKTEWVDLLTTDLNSYQNTSKAKGKNFWSRIGLFYMQHDKGLRILKRFRKQYEREAES